MIENSSAISNYLREKQVRECASNLVTSSALFLVMTLTFPLTASAIDDHSSIARNYLIDGNAQALAKNALIDSVMGKYAHVKTSSEEFSRRKQTDLRLE